MPDDYAAGTGTTGTVAVGGSATGEIERKFDLDWFAVTFEAGKSYRIDLEGASTNAGTLIDPLIVGVYDADGNFIHGTYKQYGGTGWNSRVFFEPENAGTYYIAASGHVATTGTYRLSVAEFADDHPVGTGTTGTVAVGGSATGEITHMGDRDWFAVTLEAGKWYRIDLEGSPTNAGTQKYPYLRGVYDADGNLIPGTTDDDGGTGHNARVFFEPESAGTYYIAAGADHSYPSYPGVTGTYRVSVAEVADDHPAGTGTTGTVAVGGSATGEIDEHERDQDWFAVTLEAGKLYRIDLEGAYTNAGTLSDPLIHGVYDADGNPIGGTTEDNGGVESNSRLYFEPAKAGTYYIAAGSDSSHASFDVIGTYRLSVAEVADDDHPAGTGTAGTVAVGGSANGVIERPDDQDWFAVTLEAGKPYRIDLEGSGANSWTLTDPFIRGVYDANGNPIGGTTDDDGGAGRNSRLFFEPESAGTHYIAAGGSGDSFWGLGAETGTYRLSVEELDDYVAGTATTGTVAVGGSATGEIERLFDLDRFAATGEFVEHRSDQDWFAVVLEAGKSYRIDIEGSATNAGTLTDPCLYSLRDADGNPIPGTFEDDGGVGFNSRLFFESENAGTYYIAAGIFSGDPGTYRVSVAEADADDHPAGTGTTGTVAVGGSATGDIERTGDRDWFAVTLEAGRSYRIDLEGSATNAGMLDDPYIHGVYDADGNRIGGTINDNGGVGDNSRLVFEPETAGTYYIDVGCTGSPRYSGETTGTYRVSVTDVGPVTGDDASEPLSDETPVETGVLSTDSPAPREESDAVVGGDEDDVMNGGPGNDDMRGRKGNDTLRGGAGDDDLYGGAGDDNLYGGAGDDRLNGGSGNDLLRGNAGADTLEGRGGEDTLQGGDGADTLFGGAGTDTLDGGGGDDTMHGDEGADVLRGRTGDDELDGGRGADRLIGGAGNDTLDGGQGNDSLLGGAGSDKFVFAGVFGTDTIRDFSDGEDLIDLSALSTTFADAMSGARQDGGDGRIELAGSGTIVLEGVQLSELDASDFLF